MDFTILKPGMIFGPGDHMISHISRALKILPVFAPVGLIQPRIRPVAIQDMLDIILASLLQNRLGGKTCAVLGPEEMTLGDAVWRVARAQGKLVIMLPMPELFHFAMASVMERMTSEPLVSVAQVRMLSEGMNKPGKDSENLPEDLQPKTFFTADEIRAALASS
jgi:NADH dehydrogenase